MIIRLETHRDNQKLPGILSGGIAVDSNRVSILTQLAQGNESSEEVLNRVNNFFVGKDWNKVSDTSAKVEVNKVNHLCNNIVLDLAEPVEIYSAVMSLKNTQSTGLDGIPVKLPKFTAEIISPD
ncbi:hypothetical protein HHI36_018835 [Cryptolaemus montrouzieri]|uniref:Uncharacterized protein n=1 Tax=Cryptolaemus montrouzieri TaxID=559131 RepID=A0ABD2P157_9CUCU